MSLRFNALTCEIDMGELAANQPLLGSGVTGFKDADVVTFQNDAGPQVEIYGILSPISGDNIVGQRRKLFILTAGGTIKLFNESASATFDSGRLRIEGGANVVMSTQSGFLGIYRADRWWIYALSASDVRTAIANLDENYLRIDGTNAMGADLDVGGNAIVNVGQVNGVTVEDHSARHDPGGADTLTTAAPAATGVATASAIGVAASFARSDHAHQSNTAPVDVTKAVAAIGTSGEPARADHKHDVTTAAPAATGVATASAEGVATTLARSDHAHQSNTAPSDVTKAAAAIGTSAQPARADHKHDVTTAVVGNIGTANSEGTATSLARSDHVHDHGAQTSGTLHAAVIAAGASGFMTGADKTKLDGIAASAAALTSSAPEDVTKAAAAVGVATTAARADHKHDVTTAAPSATGVATASAEGVATTLARSDHAHQSNTAPVDVTKAAAAIGTSAQPARADHKHDVTTAVVGTTSIGAAAAEGTATSLARSDHVHAVTAPAAPADVTKAAASTGASANMARADHKHDVTTAAPTATGVATASAEGVATTLARSDHAHQSNTAPSDVTKAAAAIGTSAQPARADHKHDVTTAAPSATGVATASAEGTATTLARSDHAHQSNTAPSDVTKAAAAIGTSAQPARADHKHDVTTAVVSSVGAANAEGTATSLARSDHVHDGSALLLRDGTREMTAALDMGGFPIIDQDYTAITPAPLAAQTDDWAPTGLATADVIVVTLTGSQSLTGLLAPAAESNKRVLIYNNDSVDILTLVHNSASSIAANRFFMPGGVDLSLGLRECALLGLTNGSWFVLATGLQRYILATGAPANVTKAAAAVGTSVNVAREDHKHDVTTAAPGATGVATASADGVATSLARSDHAHQSNTAPAAVTKAAAVIGTSGEPARADHKHDVTTAAPGATSVATASADGSATSLARSDHAHQSNTAPSDVTKAAAAIGTSGEPARADHKHDVTTAVVGGIGVANAEGTATSLARSDHVHQGANDFLALVAQSVSWAAQTDNFAINPTTEILLVALTGSQDLTGVVAPVAGTQRNKFIIYNQDINDTLTIKENSASSTAANRIDTGPLGDFKIPPEMAALLIYNPTFSIWSLFPLGYSLAAPGATGVATASGAGTATTLVRSDHTHQSNTAPVAVTKAAAAIGTSGEPARADHKHDATTAAPGATGVATASADGVATSLARSDHAHQSNTAPANVTKAAAAIGTSGEPARADHKHDVTTAAPGATGVATASADGSATSLARSDHTHQSNTAPVNTTVAAAVIGTSGEPARADHKHDASSLVATQANQEAASSNTVFVTPGRQHFHPAIAKFVCLTTGGATPAMQTPPSYNMTSITDAGVGRLTVTIATDFSGADWCCQATCEGSSTTLTAITNVQTVYIRNGTRAAGSIEINTRDASATTNVLADAPSLHVCGWGDHA